MSTKGLLSYSISLAIAAPIIGFILIFVAGLLFRVFTGDLDGLGKAIASAILGAPLWGAGSFFFGIIPAFFTGVLSYLVMHKLSRVRFYVLLCCLGAIFEFLFIFLIFDFKTENYIFFIGLPFIAAISAFMFQFMNEQKHISN